MPDIFFTRFENWATPGVPDVLGITDGIPFWVELKVITSNKINLRPHQIMWNYKYSLRGGRSFILSQTLPQRLLSIFPGAIVHSIAAEGANGNYQTAQHWKPSALGKFWHRNNLGDGCE